MHVKPRYLAALHYGFTAVFLLPSWLGLLRPSESAFDQLGYLVGEEPYQTFFICFGVASLGATALAVMYCFKRSETRPLSGALAIGSIVLLGLAVWQFSVSLIASSAIGVALAAGTCRSGQVTSR